MINNGCQWMSMINNGCQWLTMINYGCQWLPMINNCCQWMQWLPMVYNGSASERFPGTGANSDWPSNGVTDHSAMGNYSMGRWSVARSDGPSLSTSPKLDPWDDRIRVGSFTSGHSLCVAESRKVVQVLTCQHIYYHKHALTGHNLTGIASQFTMHLGFTCDVISVTHRSD